MRRSARIGIEDFEARPHLQMRDIGVRTFEVRRVGLKGFDDRGPNRLVDDTRKFGAIREHGVGIDTLVWLENDLIGIDEIGGDFGAGRDDVCTGARHRVACTVGERRPEMDRASIRAMIGGDGRGRREYRRPIGGNSQLPRRHRSKWWNRARSRPIVRHRLCPRRWSLARRVRQDRAPAQPAASPAPVLTP